MGLLTKDYREALISLRKKLHSEPEIAHKEKLTAEKITRFLEHFGPDELITDLGGHGVAAVFGGKEDGPTVMIRCELDALPIREETGLEYASVSDGHAHLCGHDGHMAIVSGLAPLLSAERPARGRVILLYQPAEETGEGARMVLEDKKFKRIQPDYIFALHNLPGFEASGIILRNGVFASASKGLIVKLRGASSHAGHPEDGVNPTMAASLINQALLALPSQGIALKENAMVTPIHTRIGGPAFGTSPGEGVVMFTLRSYSNKAMEKLVVSATALAEKIASAMKVEAEVSVVEPFEAVENNGECHEMVLSVAKRLGLKVIQQQDPFPWSEDFGVFTRRYKGALFGLGSGTGHVQLHNEQYDFPDSLLEDGIKMLYGIIEQVLVGKAV